MAPTAVHKERGSHGGARHGAGRPRKGPPPVTHRRRPNETSNAPPPQLPLAAIFLPRRSTQGIPADGSSNSSWSAAHPDSIARPADISLEAPVMSTAHVQQLRDELTFISENDEHADIARGDVTVDDSLINDVLGTVEPEDVAGEESASAPPLDSSTMRYLRNLKERLLAEIEKYGEPLCYRRGDLYERAPHSIFALKTSFARTAANGHPEDLLYARDVCVWFPHLLPGAPDSFKCFSDKPIARRVRSMPTDYFMLTNRYICDGRRNDDKGCGTSYQGTDPLILGQLPRFVQVAFPAYITTRAAISKTLMWQMRNTFATRFGPAPFAELISEVQHRQHAEVELMYLAAATFYGVRDVAPFSAFDDKSGYAGSSPSVAYLKGLFTDFIIAHRVYIERYVASLPLTIAKADHTFDFLKYMGGVKGERIWTSAYTMINEWEQTRGHVLAMTKSLDFVKETWEQAQAGLKAANHPPTQIVYTDSPQAERKFHENLNTTLTEAVQPVTEWTDLPAFSRSLDIPVTTTSDSMEIETHANTILHRFYSGAATDDMHLIALSIVSRPPDKPGAQHRVDLIQLRTAFGLYVFNVSSLTSPSHLLPSLRAIFTNSSIMKFGHGVRQALEILADTFQIDDLKVSLKSRTPSFFELGAYAKLKGSVSDPTSSLHILAGAVLKKSFVEEPLSEFTSTNAHLYLYRHIDCQWQIGAALYRLSSVGLPLSAAQACTNGFYVTVVQGCKAVAEGLVIGAHPGYLDAPMDLDNHTKRINISASRSLVKITKVLNQGAIMSLHKQPLGFIEAHGGYLIISTSQLRSRSTTDVFQAPALGYNMGTPAPAPSYDEDSEFVPDTSFQQWEPSNADTGIDVDLGAEDSDSDSDMDDVEPGDADTAPNMFQWNINENSSAHEIFSELRITITAVGEFSDKLPTRVLDDAFHYMDRLIRLLSKKHPAFKAFCHDFSEAIFIRDKSDVLAVQAVLEAKGVSWEYMKRAKADAINRRVRRYIPPRHILVRRLELLFDAYFGFDGEQPFFSKDAREMCKHLLEAARCGYLSDPQGYILYYVIGRDKDGLNIYRTIRGTNSVEGGFHMAIRRVFGSLRASPELAECILFNWILRRNQRVGCKNRTGRKFNGHYDIWVRDEIYELAVELGCKTSFPVPRILSTRIATSETIGIVPLSLSLAKELSITTLPRPSVVGLPHHRDTPVHTLTRLSTKPTNRYRYLQLRQSTLTPVLPVHTHKEYITFKQHINNAQFRRSGQPHPPSEQWKDVDFEKFARAWNGLVDLQPHNVVDSNQRLYYKLPQQLEVHHKKTIAWSLEQSTLAEGQNFAARRPLLELLTSEYNFAHGPAALPLPEPDGEVDLAVTGTYDGTSFDRLDPVSSSGDSAYDPGADDSDEQDPLANLVIIQSDQPENQSDSPPTETQSEPPTGSTNTAAAPNISPRLLYQSTLPGAQPRAGKSKSKADRCAVCVNAYCARRHECPGKGGRKYCTCIGHPPLKSGAKVRRTEEQVERYLTERAASA
ncbi:hypothetical protein GGX14DRAFT_672632 [Mycena pura]|uniref:3'-5' exonuclease domain-containing protein n=1 Tax=Mycena pura TaxID=153505 RepID=A0AAD6UWR1_9AGAR|nr:hypothetical protein GGX14DRAFT_672632 [Mycena pura]